MVDLLSRKFHIQSSHFICLTDERATRNAIINGIQHHLTENNIERGDAMLIFYAGHGSRAAMGRRSSESLIGPLADYCASCAHIKETILYV